MQAAPHQDQNSLCSPQPRLSKFRTFLIILNQSWQPHRHLDKNSLIVNINGHFLESDASQWAASTLMTSCGQCKLLSQSEVSLSPKWPNDCQPNHIEHQTYTVTVPLNARLWKHETNRHDDVEKKEMQCHCSSLLTDATVGFTITARMSAQGHTPSGQHAIHLN